MENEDPPRLWPIQKRCAQHTTGAFVTADTIDALADKVVGLLGDRRITQVHRYIGRPTDTPRVSTGLRLWRGGMDDNPVRRAPRRSVYVALASRAHRFQSVGFSVLRDDETEQEIRLRYNQPEGHWEGRRNLTWVHLTGWPGQPHHEDQILIEYWNSNGVGQETIYAFDDLDLINELGWDIKGDPQRHVQLWDEVCEAHDLHFEHPDHVRAGCQGRQASLADNLAVLTELARRREHNQKEDPTG